VVGRVPGQTTLTRTCLNGLNERESAHRAAPSANLTRKCCDPFHSVLSRGKTSLSRVAMLKPCLQLGATSRGDLPTNTHLHQSKVELLAHRAVVGLADGLLASIGLILVGPSLMAVDPPNVTGAAPPDSSQSVVSPREPWHPHHPARLPARSWARSLATSQARDTNLMNCWCVPTPA